MYLRKSKFLIIGISKSGYSAGNALLNLGANCTVYDNSTNSSTLSLIEKLRERGASVVNDENIEIAINNCDIVVLSPGVAIDNDIPVMARRLHKMVIGELELGSMLINNPIVAITGTNGKTTSCYLLEYILNIAGVKNFLSGNMGKPLCDKIGEDRFSIAITEVSSYQLESISWFLPHIACILNISPDHLTRHYNMENYIYLKSRILKNMRESEYAVLNFDDQVVCDFSKKTRAKVFYFSMMNKVNGSYLEDNKIYFNDEYIMDVSELSLKGGHNIQNCLAVTCICKLLGVDNHTIKEGLSTFKGVKHRQQTVEVKNGIKFINDSKATNPNSVISAINELENPTILLLGGQDKGEGYEELFERIKNQSKIVSLIIYGSSRNKLYNLAVKAGISDITLLTNFERAVNYSFSLAKDGENVLLSPGCASFDEFSSFEERGEQFISMVENYIVTDECKKCEEE